MPDPVARAQCNLGRSLRAATPKALGAYKKAQIEKSWPLIKKFGIKAYDEALSGTKAPPVR